MKSAPWLRSFVRYRVCMSRRKVVPLKDHGSVDSGGSVLTIVPPELQLPSGSVQSNSSIVDVLSVAMERFPRGRNVIEDSQIRRAVYNLFMHVSVGQDMARNRVTQEKLPNSALCRFGEPRVRRSPPGNILRPPRGNLISSSKDLNRELMSIRLLPRIERSLVASRLLKTLEESHATHSELAWAIFLISTL